MFPQYTPILLGVVDTIGAGQVGLAFSVVDEGPDLTIETEATTLIVVLCGMHADDPVS